MCIAPLLADTDPHRVLVDRLTPDFLHTANETLGIFGQTFVEAPAMFKRKGASCASWLGRRLPRPSCLSSPPPPLPHPGVYYALFGKCCCFCVGGSGETVYTATNPMGPYVERVRPPTGVLQCGCNSNTPSPAFPHSNGLSVPRPAGEHWLQRDGARGLRLHRHAAAAVCCKPQPLRVFLMWRASDTENGTGRQLLKRYLPFQSIAAGQAAAAVANGPPHCPSSAASVTHSQQNVVFQVKTPVGRRAAAAAAPALLRPH